MFRKSRLNVTKCFGFFSIGMLLLLFVGPANAQLWEPKKSVTFSSWDDWVDNQGPFGTFASLKVGAAAWCKTIPNNYVDPAVDCQLDPTPAFTSYVDESTWQDNTGTYYLAVVGLTRNGGIASWLGARWYVDLTDDADCNVSSTGHVVDRADGHSCIDPSALYALEPSPAPPDGPICNDTNPCNPANGNKSQREADYESAVGPSFVRRYNSKGSYKTGQGMAAGWRHSYSRALNEKPDRFPTMLFASPAEQSGFYHSAAEACTSGFAAIKSVVWDGDLTQGVPTFSGGNDCEISVGGTTVANFKVRTAAALLVYTPSTAAKAVTRPNGAEIVFRLDEGAWVNELDPAYTLEAVGATWVFTDKNDTEEIFDSSGRLVSITYRNGQSETLEYDLTSAQGGDDDSATLDRVTGEFGHTISLSYNSGRLDTLATPDGTTQYAYDANDNLISVTYPDLSVRQYVYEDTTLPNHLTGIIDENNDRFATWSYDTSGRAISSEHAGGKEHVTLAYNTNGSTTLTLANGATRDYTFSTQQGSRKLAMMSGDVCAKCPGGNIADKTYDSNGYIDETIDWELNTTQTIRNAEGLTETLIEAKGSTEERTTTTTWDTTYRLPTQIVSPRNTTDFTYDANGNMLTATVSSGALSRAWTMIYNSDGQPLTIDGPRTDVSDVTTLEYYVCTTGDECGQIKKITNALGHVTTYDTYDAAGRLMQMTEPNGLQLSFTYDNRGRLLTSTQTPSVGTPRVTTMTYDDVGQLATQTLPNGTVLTYTYTAAHYLASVTDNLNNSITYDYDVMGNLTDEDTKDPTSTLKRAMDYVHDLNYRLDSVTDGGFTTDLSFDLVGNLKDSTDPNTNLTQHTYDALNRLESTIDALSGTINYDYDDHDNLTQAVAANGATTDFVYNNLDDLLSESSPDRGTTNYTYDAAGNRLTATDARSITATYAYDALNRLTSISYPTSGENVTYTYDDIPSNSIGRLASISDQSGTTTYSYDEFGSVASDSRQISGVTYTVSYQYDAIANVSSITYPSGRVVSYGRDALGQITQVTSTKSGIAKTVISAADFEPFGPLSSLTYGNGLVYDYSHRTDYRTDSISATGVADKAYSFDAAGNITSIADLLDAAKSQDFTYDVLHRIDDESPLVADYSGKILPHNPVAYWRLDETSGTTAADSSGNGYDMPYVDTYTLGAASLTGDGNPSMRIPTSGGGYAGTATLTGITITGIEAWFQTDSTGDHRDFLALKGSSGTQKKIVHSKSSGYIKVLGGQFGSTVITSDASVSSNEPHHIAVWYESGTNKTYLMIDGVIQQETYTGNVLSAPNAEVYLGAFEHGGNPYKRYHGEIDEVAIYDGAVTSSTFAGRHSSRIDYAYDANGNRLSLDDGSAVTTYGYTSSSNRMATIDSVALQHDLAGNRTADVGGVRTYTYDDTGRLDGVLDNSVVTASYVHNALGQRTTKTVGSATTVYVYDTNGSLLAEHDGAGTLIRDYIRMGGTPVAQVDSGETFSYLQFDHLGTPRIATNDSQTIVWRWDSDAFGVAVPDEDPDGNSTLVTVNLRFPGQYYDVETAFHYNYFRTYDPSTGRYMESDPIGLGGGLNTYGYVGGNPLSSIDPYGLDCIAVGNSVTCTAPGGGPTATFPRPDNWPDRIDSSSPNYHYYNKQVFFGGPDAACVKDGLISDPTPGSPSPASNEGTPNNATPTPTQILADAAFRYGTNNVNAAPQNYNPVRSYVRDNGNLVINVTMPGHNLFPGYVMRYVGDSVVNNVGEGTGRLQKPNSAFADTINNAWYGQTEGIINSCGCN